MQGRKMGRLAGRVVGAEWRPAIDGERNQGWIARLPATIWRWTGIRLARLLARDLARPHPLDSGFPLRGNCALVARIRGLTVPTAFTEAIR